MMDNEKSWDTLYEKYLNLFVNKDKSPRESPMAFGIECGLGWYEILSSLCWMIKQHENNIKSRQEWNAKKHKEINQALSIEIIDPEPEYFPVKFDQVKEKYGGLRVYFSGGDEYIEGLVSMAEAISYKTCEVCGNKGEANKGGWISVLCDKHRQESVK
jgi:hypothetical protein